MQKGIEMTIFRKLLKRGAVITVTVSLFCVVCAEKDVFAQGKAKQSETADALGLGSESRFESGYTPIVIDRTTIVPGIPFNVKPTMDNLVKTSGPSMGGILNRFDTSKFGRFFGGSADAAAAMPTRNLAPAAKEGVTAAQLSAAPKIYPPRLEINYAESPQTDVADPIIKQKINEHLLGVLDRYPLTSPEEQVILVFQGRTLILRGKIRSDYTSDLLFITMQMEPGIDAVVNELEIIKSEPAPQ